MEAAAAWQQLFEQWPTTQPRVGIVIVDGQEPISFINFLLTPGIVALERERPDTHGARKVMVSFSAIMAVKLTDTRPFEELTHLGFC